MKSWQQDGSGVFDARATGQELLDQPDCDQDLAAASYRFMELVNSRFGGIRTVRRFLTGEIKARPSGSPLRILDIGSGCCDIPLGVSRWARGRNIGLSFTCLEMSGHAAEIARERITLAGDPDVQLFREDAFTHRPSEPYDYAVASMCFHHFSDTQILDLLRRLQGFVTIGVLINDLRRSWLSSLLTRLLLACTCSPTGVRHDALLSIRRGFKPVEMSALLRQLDNATVSVETAKWFRVAAIIRFNKGVDE